MLDTRRRMKKILDASFHEKPAPALQKFVFSLIFALFVAFVPTYTGLSHSGVIALFILCFSAALWVTEAIPAFAVGLLIVGLNILLLGFENFQFSPTHDWKIYLKPWSSPLVFLFFAGFIMASAASKTKLDLWLAKRIIFFVGSKPKNVLTAILAITFVFSMFISNTATAAMMLTIVLPIVATLEKGDKFAKGLLLAVSVGANIGGMGTIIGTPPNAIAVGILGEKAPDFLTWMFYGLVPAFIIAVILRYYLLFSYPTSKEKLSLKNIAKIESHDDSSTSTKKTPRIPSWKKTVVIVTFLVTIGMWLTSSIHHIPTTVVAFLPIVSFTMFKILDVDDIRELRWDVIILIFGGLSLGLAIAQSGLASWFTKLFDLSAIGLIGFILIFSYVVVVVSNFMSNSAASNVILPIVVAFGTGFGEQTSSLAVIAVALSASVAMCLPVSTPPNAIIYSSGKIDTKDLLKLGIIVGVIAPIITGLWIYTTTLF